MAYSLSAKSRKKLAGIHPDLVALIERAIQITPVDFTVLEGMRTVDRQRQLVKRGASKTMNSRHLTGHAVDIAPFCDTDDDGKSEISWQWPDYYPLAKAVKRAAKELGIAIEWGGDWRSFKDGPHWQLPWKQYPAGDMRPRARTIENSVDDLDVLLDAPITEKTETRDATEKTVAVGGAGGVGGIGVGAEPIIDAISGQQSEITSGDWARIAIAVVIVGLTAWSIWRLWR